MQSVSLIGFIVKQRIKKRLLFMLLSLSAAAAVVPVAVITKYVAFAIFSSIASASKLKIYLEVPEQRVHVLTGNSITSCFQSPANRDNCCGYLIRDFSIDSKPITEVSTVLESAIQVHTSSQIGQYRLP